ncbi:FAD/NAD(P)-binding protein [Streptomyces sp. JJ36]|uniref:FAD/NAD(P)-binding protein n=1 Tax=Streptomyces sp. JJ36 TaxID=2736645 RepID=UPI001F4279EB|nr:FAD/NAD(P)-binding protein [Streptomyces sp. JJ36]MCF6521818.1 FAD/NAD(P)-binding protein [Streptomyces sp. JJ36]
MAEDDPGAAVAVVGAGPRGTSVLERLCASVPELAPYDRLTVHVVDPEPPGAGRVWRTDQPGELLMNTVASQVTLFTDASVDAEGPVRPGPTLHEWYERIAPGVLGPDDYPTRALYGAYLEWVFGEVLRRAPDTVTVRVHRARAVRLTEAPDGTQRLALSDGRLLSGLAAVVLAQGHLPAAPGGEQRRLAAHARAHGLHHLPPANPADLTAELGALAPGEPVLLRGLGLNFFDHMALLTSGRGGRFVPSGDGGLRYLPSGREPRLYAGSRRGVPYHARGDNEKGAHGRHEPLLLTPAVVARLRRRADAGDPPDFLTEIWPLVAKEVETVYYAALLTASGVPDARVAGFRARFPLAPHGSAEETAVLDTYGVPAGRRWDWGTVALPHGGREFSGPDAYREWLLARLRRDVAQAREGNVRGPVKAALDVLRDLRNELRQIVDHSGLAGASRRDHLDRWYTPLNAFLSIGPPRGRIAEMMALIEAGVLEVLGPRLEVRARDGAFEASSPAVPGSAVRVTGLIEARLPEPDLRLTTDPLLSGLLRDGGCRPHRVGGYETGGLDVTVRPYRVIGAQGRPHPRRFAVGVPTEGVHWVTAAGARPGVNSVTLTDTDAVARAALHTLRKPCAAAPPAVAGAPALA